MSTLSLFDTRSREMKAVSTEAGRELGFYCCGPTVYGPAHIGNFRTFLVQDLFRRVLEANGETVKHVRNLTDVDDKTIKGSLAAGLSLGEFTQTWTERFHADCQALGMQAPHVEPSAVEHIPHQIRMIEALVEKGHAYPSDDGSVYFKISSFPAYGELSGLDKRELELGKTQNARANADEYEKDSLADFVLWKARRDEDGDNFWESPWGPGRPGWHLECSAMIAEHLGDSFEVHSGGVDLVFPHHENEIAQSKCACGGDFAAHWFHIAHLMVDGAKMSKSLGNLYTLEQLAEKGFSAMEVRYALLAGHYRKQLNFTLDSLRDARLNLERIAKVVADLEALAEQSLAATEAAWGDFEGVLEALNRDLNVPAALGALFSALAPVEKALKAGRLDADQARESLAALAAVVGLFAWELPELSGEEAEVPEEIQALAQERWQAKQEKNWSRADELRDQLKEAGWAIEDKPGGFEVVPL